MSLLTYMFCILLVNNFEFTRDLEFWPYMAYSQNLSAIYKKKILIHIKNKVLNNLYICI